MSYKSATYLSLLIIASFGGLFLYTSLTFSRGVGGGPVGPSFFPIIASSLLIGMCVLSAFSTMKKHKEKKEEINILNFRYIIFTVITLSLFIFLWESFGYFYLFAFVFLFGLFFVYNKNEILKKRLIFAIGLSIIMNLFVYFVFEQMLNVII